MGLFGKKTNANSAPEEAFTPSTDVIERAVQEAVESGSKKALKASNKAIQEAIQEVVDETKKTVRTVVQETKKMTEETKADEVKEEEITQLRPEVRPHAFVVMPFGQKKGGDGSLYNFNAIYQTLIKPALVEAGFDPFRADEATTSGDILTDMFQELLLADLVIADMSIDNANAFYETENYHSFHALFCSLWLCTGSMECH